MTNSPTALVRLRDKQPLGTQDVKDQSKRLRRLLSEHDLDLTSNQVLEMMARVHGFDAWGALKAHLSQEQEPASDAARPKMSMNPARISGLTADECVRRLRHYVDRYRLPSLHTMADDLMKQMLLHGNTDGPRHIDQRTLVDIEKAILIERLHHTRSSAELAWRKRGQDQLIEAIRATPFSDLICCKPAFGDLSSYFKPVLDISEGGYRAPNGTGWHYAYNDLGSYFDGMPGAIAVISNSMKSAVMATRLTREMVDRAPGIAVAGGISHDGTWASEGLQAAIEARVQDAGTTGFEDYVDKVDYVLSQVHYAPMDAIDKPLFLSIPWRPFDLRYMRLLRKAGQLNIRVILRVMAADYTEGERSHLNNALACCHTHILGPSAVLPQHPDRMPVYNDSSVPAFRINPDWQR